MGEEISFEDARRWYFFATDSYNVIHTMVKRELKTLYGSNLTVLFIDCYDLISYLFPKNMLIHEEHYDWNRAIWDKTFDALHGYDNLKICVSPPSCLELFHFLDKKAHYVYEGAPKISYDDQKNSDLFYKKLLANQYAYSLTNTLVDRASKKVPQLQKLKNLINNNIVVNASDVFDYSKSNFGDIEKTVATKFEPKKAQQYLQNHRLQYLSHQKNAPPVDLTNLGLETFSVNIDMSNITQTIYLNSVSKNTRFTFTSHGVYLLLTCHRDRGYWKDDKTDAPVMNSLLALFLARTLREFESYQEAEEFFIGAQFAFKSYLREFKKQMDENLTFGAYMAKPKRMKHLAKNKLIKSKEFLNSETFIIQNCSVCFPEIPTTGEDKFEIGPTGIKYDKNDLVDFSKDEELRKERGHEILEASRSTISDLGIFSPEKVAGSYLPPDERTSNLLLKLKGYSFDDWN